MFSLSGPLKTTPSRIRDLGILYLQPERPLVVAACTRGFWRVADAERLLARLGRSISIAIRR